MVEHVPYTVVGGYHGWEVRDYPSHCLVSVAVPGDASSSSFRGFRPLFRYISGDNVASRSIPMTAPVFQEPVSPGVYRVSFAMPRSFGPDDVPPPLSEDLSVVVVPKRLVAALRFRGLWSDRRVSAKASELLAYVADAGLDTVGAVFTARYDPPTKPPFMRRNEVLVEVAGVTSQ